MSVRRLIVVLLVVVLALVALPLGVLAQGSGVIRGQVVMGTAGANLPDDLKVELLFLPNGQGPPQTRTAPVDTSGAFRFEEVDPAPQHRYLVRVTYAGQTYFSQGGGSNTSEGPFVLGFKAGQSEIVAPLTIYETTNDSSALAMRRIHYILDERGGEWVVAALYTVENRLDRVVVPASGTGLRIPLPAQAINISFPDQATESAAKVESDGILLSQTFAPGEHDVIFTYQMPYNPPDQRLSLPLGYPAESVIVLIPELGQQTTVSGLADEGQRDVQGRSFRIFSGAQMPPDQPVDLAFAQLPPPSPASTAGAVEGAAPTAMPGPGLDAWPWWVPLALVAMVVVALAAYLWQRPAPTALEERMALRRRRDALILHLADLDDRFEAGEIGPTAYQRQRQAAKRELLDIMRRLGSQGELQPST